MPRASAASPRRSAPPRTSWRWASFGRRITSVTRSILAAGALVGVPMMLVLGAGPVCLAAVAGAPAGLDLPAVRDHLRAERARLGPLVGGRAQHAGRVSDRGRAVGRAVGVAGSAGSTKPGSLVRRALSRGDRGAAGAGAVVLAAGRLARRRVLARAGDFGKIDWGTLLLFGSGLSLGNLMFSTGLVHGHRPDRAFEALGTDDDVGDHGGGHRRRDPAERVHQQRRHRDRVDSGRLVDLPARRASSRFRR